MVQGVTASQNRNAIMTRGLPISNATSHAEKIQLSCGGTVERGPSASMGTPAFEVSHGRSTVSVHTERKKRNCKAGGRYFIGRSR